MALVQARGLVRDRPGSLRRTRIVGRAVCDRRGHAADRGHRLRELIVQFARDQATLLLDAAVHPTGQRTAVREFGLGTRGTLFELPLAPQFVDHAVESLADRSGLAAAQAAKADIEPSRSHRLERLRDLAERTNRAPDQREQDQIHDHERQQRQADDPAHVVPGVEHGARGVGLDHQASVREVDRLRGRRRRQQPGEPLRRVAPGLVGRGWRGVELPAVPIEQGDLGRAHPAQAFEEIEHRRRALRRVDPAHPVEQLSRDAVGRDHLLVDRRAHVVHEQGRNAGEEEQGEAGDDEVQLQAQRHANSPRSAKRSSARTIASTASGCEGS